MAELQTSADLDALCASLEVPLIPIISSMQYKGVALDVDFLREMSGRLKSDIAALEASIFEAGGIGKFNIGSPKQLNQVLFEQLEAANRRIEEDQAGLLD